MAPPTHKFGILARDFFCRPPDGMGYIPHTLPIVRRADECHFALLTPKAAIVRIMVSG